MGQFDLFGGGSDDAAADVSASPLSHLNLSADEWPRKQLLAAEREMLGLYVSAHPLDGAERILRKHAPKPIAAVIDEAPKEGEVVVAGMIASVDRRVNKSGESWAIVTLEDLDASIDVLFFAKSYSVLHEDLMADAAVAVKGRINWREDQMSIFGSGVVVLDISDAEHNPGTVPPFILRADPTQLEQDSVAELRSALAAHKGDTPVHILVCHEGRETALAIDDFPVNPTSALVGELKAIRGITVAV
jgi:DNA polymerase-3 subunit alpha